MPVSPATFGLDRHPAARRFASRPARRGFRPAAPAAERLEDRLVLSGVTVSVSDAAAWEGDASFKLVDEFVTAGSGGLSAPRTAVFGPDANGDGVGELFVASRDTDSVLRYDGATGSFLGAFVPAGAGGLDHPWAMTFGPDGNLYVTGVLSNAVHRYDGATGAPIGDGVYVAAGASGLSQPKGIAFGPDGNLYVSSTSGPTGATGHEVLRFAGPNSASPGAPLPAGGRAGATFVVDGSGGLANPNGLAFGPDGNLYVASTRTDNVLRYDGATGAFLGEFVTAGSGGLDGPNALAFRDGRLWVSSQHNGRVLRYDAATGAYIDTAVTSGSGGLSGAMGLAFDAEGDLYVPSEGTNGVLRYGAASKAAFTVRLSGPSADPVTLNWSTQDGTAVAGADYVAASGTVTFLPGETERVVTVETLNDGAVEPPESFSLVLTGVTGATAADGVGIAAVADDDTKFYVVDDAAADRTFEYGGAGAAGQNTGLSAGNTAPRGAASTAAGDRVWVIDANRNVYVYDADGALLGSWTANGLSTPEGIATDGVDVWVVDRGTDRVYRYANAASRVSGSQAAASSFALNIQNKEAKGIEVAGGRLYVVDDTSKADKVFVYATTGGLFGSWTIDAANKTPTGITLDPRSPSDVWIVDAGTDRVYRYANAASRTSGSQNAADSFALAAGNTNPQGIADPPVGDGAAIPLVAGAEAAPSVGGDGANRARGPRTRGGVPVGADASRRTTGGGAAVVARGFDGLSTPDSLGGGIGDREASPGEGGGPVGTSAAAGDLLAGVLGEVLEELLAR